MKCTKCGATEGLSPYGSEYWQCDICGALTQSETDPNGVAPHEPGAKLDAGKVKAGVLGDFSLALTEVAKVGTFGAEKYSRRGWEVVENAEERYFDAEWRHLLKSRHEDIDQDSGLLHLAHQCWNTLARLELRLRRGENDLLLLRRGA